MQTKLDSLIANVYNLDKVLKTLRDQLNLKPFVSTTIQLGGVKTARMALVNIGNADLEFIESAEVPHPTQMSQITEVEIQSPAVQETTIVELEAGLKLRVLLGKKSGLKQIITHSHFPVEDAETLLLSCDNCCEQPNPNNGRKFSLNGIHIYFLPKPDPDLSIPSPEDLSVIHGWRRFALKIHNLESAVALLEKSGARTVVPIFQVMPGLREAMMMLPSGLIVQPVEQKLWKMLPHFLWQRMSAREKVRPK